ncbi:tyrosine-type recombinase/integrase [Lysinibacillus sp. Ag94]|uniref:tyrosine-type recombinase/integrase n=1 Tax=Lysinibacillus sp. Ag94 TaxID=2936682 RepID=UPI00200BCA50|nr:tyrosine-type recombinase/integrase [Lysinibacillus sp. Ag94]UPW84008.1 tyrosine-type recombinase/integrase [Lysinibacillus sp. Ag94]
MNKYTASNALPQNEYWDLITSTLSSYEAKEVLGDGKLKTYKVEGDYFLVNDVWNVDTIGKIPNFAEQYKEYKNAGRKIIFSSENPSVSLELKFVFYLKLFNDGWRLSSAFNSNRTELKRLNEYLNERHPRLPSLLALDIDKEEKQWIWWLTNKGIATTQITKDALYGNSENKSASARFLRSIYNYLSEQTDTREELEKDRWDVRILNKKYGIKSNPSKNDYYINFEKVQNEEFRKHSKKYIKNRLLGARNFSWGTARNYIIHLSMFLNFVSELEPDWNSLNELTREHFEKYLEYLNHYTKNNLKQKNANPTSFTIKNIGYVKVCLEDLQRYEYSIAPKKPVVKLIYPGDIPNMPKKATDDIEHVPDFVLEQLFEHINELHPDVQPVVWVMYKTGLRVSDTLGLTQECLFRLNGKSSVKTDIEKTYVINHKIPIDEELANLLAILIDKSKKLSNEDNNPDKFIFVRYTGSRKGKPFGQRWIQKNLYELAHKKEIIDEMGNIFRFKNHAFRHTFGIKMINGGADILTVQELLAHASPEMTMRYAKLLDDTKRKEFEKVVKSGVFSFDLDGKVHQVTENEGIPEDVMDALWRDEKLYALDNPYGTCRARVNGNCPLAAEPPCLTANNGKPCFDLSVGMTSFDVKKYELHIESTAKMIEAAKEYGREDMIEANEKNLERYQEIYNTIKSGSVIFGNLERMHRKLERMRKKGVKNG